MKKLSLVLIISAITLMGCEQQAEIKNEANEVKKEVSNALTSAWNDVKESALTLKDDSLTDLIKESEALTATLAGEGKDLSQDLLAQSKELIEQSKSMAKESWLEGKENANELSEEAHLAIEKLAEKIKAQREAIEQAQ